MSYKVLEDKQYSEKVKKRILKKSYLNEITGCRIWTGSKDANGYGAVHLYDQYLAVHRVAYEVLVGPIPEGKILMHKCDNPSCIEPLHLIIGTTYDNNKDRAAKGRTHKSYGEDNPYSKLKEHEVITIKKIFKKNSSITMRKYLSKKYNVSEPCIYAIKKGVTWKHIKV